MMIGHQLHACRPEHALGGQCRGGIRVFIAGIDHGLQTRLNNSLGAFIASLTALPEPGYIAFSSSEASV